MTGSTASGVGARTVAGDAYTAAEKLMDRVEERLSARGIAAPNAPQAALGFVVVTALMMKGRRGLARAIL
jgi:hypothetical protein